MKIFHWLSDNILFVLTLFLLAFIPLYPKKPLIDIVNTWVYIRAEDFVVVLVILVWSSLLIRGKIRLKTPLTVPIMLFWIVGALATIHGVLLIFPTLANSFPNVAFLSFLRRVEYMSLFFVAYAGMRDKRFLPHVISVLTVTLICVSLYGIGQKYFGFPAYLTMNEEFAKGIPIQLSALSRVPSTFGGHYDLAAYLVLVIPILTSVVFGIRNWLMRLVILSSVGLGFLVLFMTVSRVSFFVLFIALAIVLFLHKKRFVLLSLPVVVVVLAFLFLQFSPRLADRFGNTVKEVDVLVDATSGTVIGHVKQVPAEYFQNKFIQQKTFRGGGDLASVSIKDEPDPLASQSVSLYPNDALPANVFIVILPNAPTGENLPQGTGYINLSLSPVTKELAEFFYETSKNQDASEPKQTFVFFGDFLIKRASAYDLSFTTRYQGEWPHAIDAFKRNIFFGSGYSSISLAVDNNYLRILGEVGLLGFASFLAIFMTLGIYIRKVLPDVDSSLGRSFVLGFVAGVIGLAFNALLIDVFEASKIAYVLWLLVGITLGLLHLYQSRQLLLFTELKKAAVSTYAMIGYVAIVAIVVFSPMLSNYFVGDDFTWLRWAADCGSAACSSVAGTITNYFTQADGFFYRPGTKLYFSLMYSLFWLNQAVYHLISLVLHIAIAILLYLLAKKILRDNLLSAMTAILFLIQSGYSETVFWIASTGHLFNVFFILLSVLFFALWDEKRKTIYFILSLFSVLFSLLFHELGIVAPLLIVLYASFTQEGFIKDRLYRKAHYLLIFAPIILYFFARVLAQSHWFSGDYSYNLIKLPFNAVGNSIGYLFLTFFGPVSLPFYQFLRSFSREHILVGIGLSFVIIFGAFFGYRLLVGKLEKQERRIIVFGFLFFIISLLPFIGLGNITSRYSYLASVGFMILLAFSIKKLHVYLQKQGKDIALLATITIISIYSLFHLIQLQQIHSDWYEAGLKANRFFIAIDGLYADYWSKEPMQFHFVNVPIRKGEAWVFPVGLDDALWFIFRNPRARVYQWQSVDEALRAVDGSKNQKVFVFEDDGRVIEKIKPLMK